MCMCAGHRRDATRDARTEVKLMYTAGEIAARESSDVISWAAYGQSFSCLVHVHGTYECPVDCRPAQRQYPTHTIDAYISISCMKPCHQRLGLSQHAALRKPGILQVPVMYSRISAASSSNLQKPKPQVWLFGRPIGFCSLIDGPQRLCKVYLHRHSRTHMLSKGTSALHMYPSRAQPIGHTLPSNTDRGLARVFPALHDGICFGGCQGLRPSLARSMLISTYLPGWATSAPTQSRWHMLDAESSTCLLHWLRTHVLLQHEWSCTAVS